MQSFEVGDLVWCKVKGKYYITSFHVLCVVESINEKWLAPNNMTVSVCNIDETGIIETFDVDQCGFEKVGVDLI